MLPPNPAEHWFYRPEWPTLKQILGARVLFGWAGGARWIPSTFGLLRVGHLGHHSDVRGGRFSRADKEACSKRDRSPQETS